MGYIFETEHLKIRKFRREDALSLYRNHLEENVRKWIPNECYGSLEEAESAAVFFEDRVNKGILPYVLAVEWKENSELIGDVGINEVAGKPEEVEIGYTVSQRYSGNGYATELLRAMTEFVSSTLGHHVLYGRVMRGNDASVRVLEKTGMFLNGKSSLRKTIPTDMEYWYTKRSQNCEFCDLCYILLY